MVVVNKFSAFVSRVAGRLLSSDNDGFLEHAIFLADYTRKYGLSPIQVEDLIRRQVLAAKMIEGLWVVEDKPPATMPRFD
jgi:hypothetical protein